MAIAIRLLARVLDHGQNIVSNPRVLDSTLNFVQLLCSELEAFPSTLTQGPEITGASRGQKICVDDYAEIS
jgi:hypothetical protein